MIYTRRTQKTGAIALYPNRKRLLMFINRIKDVFNKSQTLSATELINKLNPMIRGWANYFNLDNSSRYRTVLREALYRMTWLWVKKKHPTLGKIKLAEMYFLKKTKEIDPDTITEDSPRMVDHNEEGKYMKMKNYR